MTAQAETPRRRASAEAVEMARTRARVGAARVALRRPGLDPMRRGGARYGRQIAPLTAQQLPETSPAVDLLLMGKGADLVLDAAAAALLSPLISDAITPAALSTVPISRPAREFGLRHAHLAMTLDELPKTDAFQQIRTGLRALWVTLLPQVLAVEMPDPGQPLHLPTPERPKRHVPKTRFQMLSARFLRRRKPIVLPLASDAPIEDRAAAALLAAIRAFQEGRG